jgi:hypothetical protein
VQNVNVWTRAHIRIHGMVTLSRHIPPYKNCCTLISTVVSVAVVGVVASALAGTAAVVAIVAAVASDRAGTAAAVAFGLAAGRLADMAGLAGSSH